MRIRNVQIIVESHSEHLLRRLQRRVAEGNLIDAEGTAPYFCDIDASGATLKSLDMDLYGNIRNWPKDFFGDEMADIAAMSQAAFQRRNAEA